MADQELHDTCSCISQQSHSAARVNIQRGGWMGGWDGRRAGEEAGSHPAQEEEERV